MAWSSIIQRKSVLLQELNHSRVWIFPQPEARRAALSPAERCKSCSYGPCGYTEVDA
jgi:hypothetical protein